MCLRSWTRVQVRDVKPTTNSLTPATAVADTWAGRGVWSPSDVSVGAFKLTKATTPPREAAGWGLENARAK